MLLQRSAAQDMALVPPIRHEKMDGLLQIKEDSSKQGEQENCKVALINPTPSNRQIEGMQRGELEIVATRWTELRRHLVSVCEYRQHRVAPKACGCLWIGAAQFGAPLLGY
jgi:hypothetical protein